LNLERGRREGGRERERRREMERGREREREREKESVCEREGGWGVRENFRTITMYIL
jgi:hypothetical protein